MNKLISMALFCQLIFSTSFAQNELFVKTITGGGSLRSLQTRTLSKLPLDNRDLGPYLAAAGWTQNPRSGEQQLMRSLLYVDLSTLPEKAVIHKATLFLFANRSNYIGNIGNPMYGNRNELVFEMATGKWDAKTISWAGQPGGKGEDARKLKQTAGTLQNDSVDITPFVRHWIDKPDENNGMIMRLEQEKSYSTLRIAHSSVNVAIDRYSSGLSSFDPLSFSSLANSRIYYSENAPDSLQPRLVILYSLKMENKVRLYPVPASTSLTLTVTADKDGEAIYEILDAAGHTVSMQNAAIGRGKNILAVKGVTSLGSGFYTLRLRIDNNLTVKKFTILK
ncbi:DNRLRE domain-containing protein [Flavitalea flava]